MREQGPKPTLVAEISKRRVQAEKAQQSILEAQEERINLFNSVGSLLQPHFSPLPGDMPREAFDALSVEEKIQLFDIRNEPRMVRLEGRVPSEQGGFIVKIDSDKYPRHNTTIPTVSYYLDVDQLDQILVISSEEARVESRSLIDPEFDTHSPVHIYGYKIPAWSRPANSEDITQYQQYVDQMLEADTSYFTIVR
jgi:hypothetical protein